MEAASPSRSIARSLPSNLVSQPERLKTRASDTVLELPTRQSRHAEARISGCRDQDLHGQRRDNLANPSCDETAKVPAIIGFSGGEAYRIPSLTRKSATRSSISQSFASGQSKWKGFERGGMCSCGRGSCIIVWRVDGEKPVTVTVLEQCKCFVKNGT
eukprot:825708-Rhodomonas_salina.1